MNEEVGLSARKSAHAKEEPASSKANLEISTQKATPHPSDSNQVWKASELWWERLWVTKPWLQLPCNSVACHSAFHPEGSQNTSETEEPVLCTLSSGATYKQMRSSKGKNKTKKPQHVTCERHGRKDKSSMWELAKWPSLGQSWQSAGHCSRAKCKGGFKTLL